jgi:hypothetical protein
VLADPDNTIKLCDTAIKNFNPDVSPKSVVVVSVYLTDDPLTMDMRFPALAFDPDVAVYSTNKPLYEEDGTPNTLKGPEEPILKRIELYSPGALESPMVTVLSEKTSKMVNAEISFTLNKDPDKVSFTIKRFPWDPYTPIIGFEEPEPATFSC